MTTIKIVNTETGEEAEREMTVEELTQLETDKAQAQERNQAQAETAAARQAILDRLGLTADEAALLLGAK